jgi:cytochrome c oxidase cbb3-type subunit 1
MTYAPTNAQTEPLARATSADVTPIDTAARGPLLLLLGSSIVWLVVASALGLITAIQLHSPQFLANCSWLTFGRTDAMRESVFIYGWAANAGLAIALWILGRLGGNLLRAGNWIFFGAVFWNVALTAGVIGIAVGDQTSFSLFQLPRYVQPMLVFSYASIAIAGVLAWMDRRTEMTFAAQWYAAAALFLFPWLSSAAQLTLLWSPMRGVAQAVGGSWYAQGAWTMWLAPLALASAYYIIPKVTGKVIPNYDFAQLGFWVLIFAGAWTGGRRLIGGPVPAWLATIAVVAGVVMLIHYAIVALNLRGAFGASGTAAKFIRFGFIAYLITGALETLTAFRAVAEQTQFTFFSSALDQLALYGAVSMMFFGAIYSMVPRLTGHGWASTGLTLGHSVVVKFGVIVLVVALSVVGGNQGVELLDPKVSIGDVMEHAKLTLLVVSAAQLILLGANLLLLVNFFQTITATVVTDVVALNPMQKEASAS